MSICIKDQIQNMNIVIGCTVGCVYCYARNNVKRWHMIDDFAAPEFFPGKLKMMEKKRPQNFLLTGMSELSGWKPEWAWSLTDQAHKLGIPVFMKDDLVPIIVGSASINALVNSLIFSSESSVLSESIVLNI